MLHWCHRAYFILMHRLLQQPPTPCDLILLSFLQQLCVYPFYTCLWNGRVCYDSPIPESASPSEPTALLVLDPVSITGSRILCTFSEFSPRDPLLHKHISFMYRTLHFFLYSHKSFRIQPGFLLPNILFLHPSKHFLFNHSYFPVPIRLSLSSLHHNVLFHIQRDEHL